MNKKPIKNPVLQTWDGLNEALRSIDDEKTVKSLIREEQRGRARQQFLLRLHSRLNKLRADRERKKLLGARS